MLLRLLLSAGLFCGMAAADEGPWARFFNQPATTVPQGTQQALSTALSSALNPLSLKAPSYPTLAVPDNAKISRLAPLPCSVPLLEYKAPTTKNFTPPPETADHGPGFRIF